MLVDLAPAPAIRIGRAGLVTLIASLGLLLALVLWALFTQISGAVVASGKIAVLGKPKAAQHLDGGVVQDILVADGDLVTKGQAGAQAVDFSTNLAHQLEREIFTTRAEIQAGRTAQLHERIRQFGNQIAGVNALIAAKRDQVGFIEQELSRQQELRDKKLVRDGDVLILQGNRADLLGQIAEHLTESARIENSVRDTELEILQADRQFREQAVTDLQATSQQIEELIPQIISTEKQLQRIEITAPVAGTAHELQVVTVGGIVPPGALIAQIIPADTARAFEFRVAPTAVDNIQPGQAVRLRFAAFNARTTPEIVGAVSIISPTTVMDEATGMMFFRVFVDVSPDEIARLGDLDLIPGMPIEGYIQTGERTVADYLTRPIIDSLAKAFRAE